VNKRIWGLLLIAPVVLCGCAFFNRGLDTDVKASSSLVDFLYPNQEAPPREDSIPELRLPLRVGLAFLPSKSGNVQGLEAARQDELLERIRKHFADRKFVSRIEIVPEYYLQGTPGLQTASAPGIVVCRFPPYNRCPWNGGSGFDRLASVQRLFNVDVMALVSYDQVTYRDENNWSLGYLTIVGAYVLKGNRHDVTTLVDLAVVDPQSRSIVLRAGGTDTRHGNSTLVKVSTEARESRTEGFSSATDQLITNFDAALTKFESDVRAGKANVRVVSRNAPRAIGGSSSASRVGGGGGGAFEWAWLLGLTAICALAATHRRRTSKWVPVKEPTNFCFAPVPLRAISATGSTITRAVAPSRSSSL
jgi:rhombotail lipoprotein